MPFNPDELIKCIPLKEYESLKNDAAFLRALEACGVDNWEGFGDALEDFKTNYIEEE